MDQWVHLGIDGMGIVLYSAKVMSCVEPGTNFLETEFWDGPKVAEHVLKGDITAFCTGSPGEYDLHFLSGYPTDEEDERLPVAIRLGIEVRGGSLQFCDLFWLSNWDPNFPPEQVLPLPDGFYHVTVCTRRPDSGRWGDHQEIAVYLQPLEAMPKLKWFGVPLLLPPEDWGGPEAEMPEE